MQVEQVADLPVGQHAHQLAHGDALAAEEFRQCADARTRCSGRMHDRGIGDHQPGRHRHELLLDAALQAQLRDALAGHQQGVAGEIGRARRRRVLAQVGRGGAQQDQRRAQRRADQAAAARRAVLHQQVPFLAGLLGQGMGHLHLERDGRIALQEARQQGGEQQAPVRRIGQHAQSLSAGGHGPHEPAGVVGRLGDAQRSRQ